MPSSPKLNVLIAYPYLTPRNLGFVQEMGEDVRLLIDCGAFTAWKSGKPIALDDYCRFLETLPFTPWRYFTLDVIGDADGTCRNYETMLRRGFTPVPIHTRGESLAMFESYFETSDMVALGGLVGGGNSARSHVKAMQAHARGRKLHLLGFTAFNWLKYLQPYSADSSSWEGAGRFGQADVYLGHGRFDPCNRRDMHNGPPSDAVCRAIRAFGFDPHLLQYDASWRGDNSLSRWMSCASWIAASLDVERALGTYLFLALSAERGDMLRDCFYGLTQRTSIEAARMRRSSIAGRKAARSLEAMG